MILSRNFAFRGVALAAALCLFAAAAEAQDKAKPGRGEAKVELGGKEITVDYGRPSTSGKGYKSMEAGVKEGFIWRMGSNKATKLTTASDLKFGDTVVKAGSYALWGKRVSDGWHLLFHPKADVWGYPSPKDGFVHEVALVNKKTDANVELVTIELAKVDDKTGEFKLTWGKDEATAKFTLAE